MDLNADTGPARRYTAIGGADVVAAVAEAFYAGVAADPVLRALYPDDLAAAQERMRAYLAQFWGGPRDYAALRGAPALRLRHAPFRIGHAQRTAWVAAMIRAVDQAGVPEPHRSDILDELRVAATALVNS